MGEPTEKIRNQRLVCEKLCGGLFMKKPTVIALISMMLVICGGVYAYWADSSRLRSDIKSVEIDMVWTKRNVDRIQTDIAELKQSNSDNTRIILYELRTIKQGLK